jgi:hypothetical protein
MIIAFGLRLRRAPRALAWSAPDRRRRRPDAHPPRWPVIMRSLRMATLAVAGTVALSGAGLVLGGYRGALAVLAMAGALGALARTWPRTSVSWLLGGLLIIGSVVGAAGGHLVFSGDAGRLVTLTSNVLPQLICLLVVGGMAGALISPVRERED